MKLGEPLDDGGPGRTKAIGIGPAGVFESQNRLFFKVWPGFGSASIDTVQR